MGNVVHLDLSTEAAQTASLRRRALQGSAVVAAALVAVAVHRPVFDQDSVLGLLVSSVTVTLIATGLLLAYEPGQRFTARLFLAAGLMWSITWLASWQTGPWPGLASLGAAYAGVGAWGFLRYPGQRLQDRWERWWVAVLVAWLGLGKLVLVALAEPSWLYEVQGEVWWPPAVPSLTLFTAWLVAYNSGAAALALLFPVLFVRRYRRLTGLDRRVLRPVAVAAVGSCLGTAAVALSKALSASPVAEIAVYRVTAFALLAVPAAFLAGVVRRQLAFAGLSRLVVRVNGSTSTADLELALRDALGDESLRLQYWVPASRGYVDPGGSPSASPSATATVVPVLDNSNEPLARVVAHRDLARHGDLLHSAVKASGLALENGRLQASLRAQIREVEASRVRIVEAAVSERRRLERDLHDGAQQRLLALNLQLSAAQYKSSDPGAVAAIGAAKGELRQALVELRELAHGIHPALLTQSGLAPALAAVAERLPLRVNLTIPAGRFQPAIESTVYYIVCEALTNTVKHAAASAAEVRLHAEQDQVVVQVRDDGAGGADAESGRGLKGLEDRVRALSGRLTVESPLGGGTRVVASLPCG